MKPIIVSFYTDNWDYPKYAEKLKQDCARLNLGYYIIPKENTNSYVSNCNMKPFVIEDALREFKRPVIWMDVDGTINKFPEILNSESITEYDLAGFRSRRDPSRIHVATNWFNYNERSLDFIKRWQESAVKFLDDGAFQDTMTSMKDEIKILDLPSEYFNILLNHHEILNESHYFVHRLSSSELKWEYKNKVERR